MKMHSTRMITPNVVAATTAVIFPIVWIIPGLFSLSPLSVFPPSSVFWSATFPPLFSSVSGCVVRSSSSSWAVWSASSCSTISGVSSSRSSGVPAASVSSIYDGVCSLTTQPVFSSNVSHHACAISSVTTARYVPSSNRTNSLEGTAYPSTNRDE